jgi:hypothetical protein
MPDVKERKSEKQKITHQSLAENSTKSGSTFLAAFRRGLLASDMLLSGIIRKQDDKGCTLTMIVQLSPTKMDNQTRLDTKDCPLARGNQI